MIISILTRLIRGMNCISLHIIKFLQTLIVDACHIVNAIKLAHVLSACVIRIVNNFRLKYIKITKEQRGSVSNNLSNVVQQVPTNTEKKTSRRFDLISFVRGVDVSILLSWKRREVFLSRLGIFYTTNDLKYINRCFSCIKAALSLR